MINACFATRVKYGEPMFSFMDKFLAHLDPDEVLSNAPCLSDFAKDAATSYALQVMSPMIFIGCLVAAYFISLWLCKGRLMFDGIFNVIGEVLVDEDSTNRRGKL